MNKFKLAIATKEMSAATRLSWAATISEIEEKIEPSRYWMVLGTLDGHGTSATDGTATAYCLVPDGSDAAEAVLEIALIRHGKGAPRAKALNIYLHPRFDLAARESIDLAFLTEYSDIIGGSLTEAIRQTLYGDDPVNELKLYARSDQMYGYFQVIALNLTKNGGVDGLNVHCHGRWLVFARK